MSLPKMIPTFEETKYVREYLQEGSVANRGEFDGDWFKQFFGVMAQLLVCNKLGLKPPVNEQSFDGGYDVEWKGMKWDVKCEVRSVNFNSNLFVHNVNAKQINYKAEGFIFVSYNKTKGIYTLCGFITKEDFLKHAEHFPKGTHRERKDGTHMVVSNVGGMYEIKQRKLKKF